MDALLPNRKTIAALYYLDVDEDSLEQRYHRIIHEMVVQNQTIKKYAKNTQISLEYLSDLYTNIALTQIMWQLEYGCDDRTMKLTNLLVENIRTGWDG